MYFWSVYVMFLIGMVWNAAVGVLAFPLRWHIHKLMLVFGFVLLNFPFGYLRLKHVKTLFGDEIGIVMSVITLLFYLVFFKDKIWKKVLLFVLLMVCSIIAEVISCLFLRMNGIIISINFDNMETVVVYAVIFVVNTLIGAVLLVVWRTLFSKSISIKNIRYFFIFPLSQFVILYALGTDTRVIRKFSDTIFIMVGTFLGFIADFILLHTLMKQAEKEKLEKQLQEMDTLRQLESVHYRELEKRRTEIAKISHDFNNQLSTAYHLLEQGNSEHSRVLLDTLKNEIIKTRGTEFCANSIVNAVLNEKSRICASQQIRLETELEIADELAMDPVHICSVFSNLLDNAIHAAVKCREEERFIQVKAAMIGDYIHIKVENSALEQKKKMIEDRKQYGHKILNDIAAVYQGEFQSQWLDGVYRAMLSLTMVKGNL